MFFKIIVRSKCNEHFRNSRQFIEANQKEKKDHKTPLCCVISLITSNKKGSTANFSIGKSFSGFTQIFSLSWILLLCLLRKSNKIKFCFFFRSSKNLKDYHSPLAFDFSGNSTSFLFDCLLPVKTISFLKVNFILELIYWEEVWASTSSFLNVQSYLVKGGLKGV